MKAILKKAVFLMVAFSVVSATSALADEHSEKAQSRLKKTDSSAAKDIRAAKAAASQINEPPCPATFTGSGPKTLQGGSTTEEKATSADSLQKKE